jgi:hypothetical protein
MIPDHRFRVNRWPTSAGSIVGRAVAGCQEGLEGSSDSAIPIENVAKFARVVRPVHAPSGFCGYPTPQVRFQKLLLIRLARRRLNETILAAGRAAHCNGTVPFRRKPNAELRTRE